MAETLLTGTWKCVSWENRDAAGKVDYPLGKDIIGYITYTPDGHILVQLMAAERPLIPDGELFACTGEETIAAANSHVSYCGTYEIQPGGIVHHILEACSFPNWTGSVQERHFKVEGDRLTLSSPRFQSGGREISATVVWERV